LANRNARCLSLGAKDESLPFLADWLVEPSCHDFDSKIDEANAELFLVRFFRGKGESGSRATLSPDLEVVMRMSGVVAGTSEGVNNPSLSESWTPLIN